jgi:ubiquinone/menaquinone biosynthesis C-methylase UbiE
MPSPNDAQNKAAATYNAAADSYDHPVNSFWERFGRQTVERLALTRGAQVLDVCCGSGASAIPAAEIVGPTGRVIGIDLADNLLHLAQEKAQQRGLSNIEFRSGDLQQLEFSDHSFDAVICVFGLFFVPDMQAALRELWRLVRPGGNLAITTWGPNFFEPANSAFWNSVRAVRPDLYKGFNPWDRITEPADLRLLFAAAGALPVEITAAGDTHPLKTAEDWWPMVLGTGYRGTLELMDASDQERVRRENKEFIERENIRSVEANVVYAIAMKTNAEDV